MSLARFITWWPALATLAAGASMGLLAVRHGGRRRPLGRTLGLLALGVQGTAILPAAVFLVSMAALVAIRAPLPESVNAIVIPNAHRLTVHGVFVPAWALWAAAVGATLRDPGAGRARTGLGLLAVAVTLVGLKHLGDRLGEVAARERWALSEQRSALELRAQTTPRDVRALASRFIREVALDDRTREPTGVAVDASGSTWRWAVLDPDDPATVDASPRSVPAAPLCEKTPGGRVRCSSSVPGSEALEVEGVEDALSVASSADPPRACAVTAGGHLRCWELAARDRSPPRATPLLGDVPVDQIALGPGFTCARAGPDVYCWGYNAWGQLCDGSTEPRATPVKAQGISDAVSIAVAAGTTCIVRRGGAVACCGRQKRF